MLPELETETGVDLGLTHYAILSGGDKIANPRWLRRREKKLAKLQRALSGKEKGSKNRDKARAKVARQHVKVADARHDFLHQVSTSIIRENQAVHVETLSVRGLARGCHAKSVNDASWGAFLALLEGKAVRYGRILARVGRCYPSSQLCPCCGWRVGRLPLGVRGGTARLVVSTMTGTSPQRSTSCCKDNASPWSPGWLDTAKTTVEGR
ncbi:RNA-guided endonuclease TnpB family protein [Nonomuraea dietziae]|uniref:IS605 OrfB family transposase n=1 Tax=Nonomuraea dietziae TaxID=65515 RepID=A0A7W5UXH6_9ACTN|nr:IS605 OrfB family transposase [Nonomuraea dietziae]